MSGRFRPQPGREWINALLKTLVNSQVIPEKVKIKNLLHQTVVKSIL
jgi:hypothetical protein